MGRCDNCIDVRNTGKKFCKFCGLELTRDSIAAIELLEAQPDSITSLFAAHENPNLIEEARKRQSATDEQRRREQERKRRAEADRKRELENQARLELERTNRIKASMTESELLQFELQEKILEVLLHIANRNQKDSNGSLSFSSLLMGLSSLMESEEEQ